MGRHRSLPFDNVSLWPRRGTAPNDAPSKADYFDTLFHSSAVVGINTSALIEGGIVGRAVHTFLLPEFQTCQEGTLHFHYLLDAGLLRAGRDLTEHIAQLAATLAAADPAQHSNRAFVEAFVRPHGLSVSATDTFVDAVERLASLSPRRCAIHCGRRSREQPFDHSPGTPAARSSNPSAANGRYREKAAESLARNAALQGQRAAEKAQRVMERRLRAEAQARERAERVARHQEAKQQRRAEKLREREERLTRERREKQRHAWKATVAKYYRRLIHSSSGS
jgi:hypothetical protein